MSMRLGSKTTIVVSSPKAAELFLKTHDTIFASRPQVQASKHMSYGTKAMAFSEYGPYWRHVRKLCTLQLLSPLRIEAFAPLRREEVGLLVQSLKVAAEAGEVVDLSEKVSDLIVGITYRMVLGRKNNDMFDLKGIIEEVMFLTGAFNISDYVPFLVPLDLQYPTIRVYVQTSHFSISPRNQEKMSPSEITILILVFLTFLWSLLHILINASSRQSQKLPPGPRALPIIGNLHMLGNLPHRSLQNLAKKYGPIMSMRLGSKTTIVVSSPKAAELFLKTHDTIFASRPQVQASKYMSYGTKAMGFSEYGPYWRHVRKLCTLQLLSPSRIEAFAPLRREEVGLLMQSLKVAAEAGEVVDLSEKVGELVVGITYRMVLGRKNNDMFDLKGIIEEVMFLSGAFNIGDYVPFLIPLDLQVCYPLSLITKIVTCMNQQ
ncbi:unnamed protein product [Malus baccata var. baccata]